MTDLFIGVVSHATSRFASNCGPDGFAHRLSVRLALEGMDCSIVVNTRDDHDPVAIPVTATVVDDSLDATFRLEKQWADYLAAGGGRRSGPWVGIVTRLRSARAHRRARRPVDGAAGVTRGTRMVERLINIELSHLHLLRTGVRSQAPWILILEDDAGCLDIEDCAAGVHALLTDPVGPAYVNLSRSFSPSALGIDGLLTESGTLRWQGHESRRVLAASRPVTNTVCAIAYRREFAVRLVAELEAMPMTPVVPIDWKLNAALMSMFEAGWVGCGDCWLVEPAPIIQMSMHGTSGP